MDSIDKIRKETTELLEVISGVNDRTQTLASSAEEIAAASNTIISSANEVKEVLKGLIQN